jgi:outer membrane biosynthesis protein TonB
MRTDYILYVIAVICFIIAGWVGAALPFTASIANTATVIVLAIIGIIFVWGGYSLRPSTRKATRMEPTTLPTKPAMEKEQPAVAPMPSPEIEPEPTPAPAVEPAPIPEPEPAKTEETPQPETPPSETKPVRKRRERKKTKTQDEA